jgi:hypothetical protein
MSLRVVSVIFSSVDFVFTDSFIIYYFFGGTGVEAYNAFSVVESLTSLAQDYSCTVVFTIQQPLSNS